MNLCHVSIMELVIWMQINLLGFWAKAQGGAAQPEDWEGLLLGNLRGPERFGKHSQHVGLSLFESGLMSCVIDTASKTPHCCGWVGVSLNSPNSSPQFSLRANNPHRVFLRRNTPFWLSFPQSHDCQACVPGGLSVCSCLPQPRWQ